MNSSVGGIAANCDPALLFITERGSSFSSNSWCSSILCKLTSKFISKIIRCNHLACSTNISWHRPEISLTTISYLISSIRLMSIFPPMSVQAMLKVRATRYSLAESVENRLEEAASWGRLGPDSFTCLPTLFDEKCMFRSTALSTCFR